MSGGPRRVGILFAQFAAYHIDRCEAVGRRLTGRAEVIAIEVATKSDTYAWEASGGLSAAAKQTLFPGRNYDDISWWRRLWAQFGALRRCDMAVIGISYGLPDIMVLAWLLRFCGVDVVVCTESKFDDKPRSVWLELLKSFVLAPYTAAIVGAERHRAYFEFLGFRRRPVLPGYDTIGVERIRGMDGLRNGNAESTFAARPFIFVGRFVDKKNLIELVDAFALYHSAAGANGRRLLLIGSGVEEEAIRTRAEQHGVIHAIEFPGFLDAEGVARALSGSLALVLPSLEEQWGLVVNEALAFGLPVIASSAVGSTDVLVRNLVNGYVVEPGHADSLARAMLAMDQDEALWQQMVTASHGLAWLGDTERLADAIEVLLGLASPEAEARIAAFWREVACKSGLPTTGSRLFPEI